MKVEDPLYVSLCLCHIDLNLRDRTILDTLEKVRNRFLTAECSHFALMGSYYGSIHPIIPTTATAGVMLNAYRNKDKVSKGAKIRNQNRLACVVGIDPFHRFKTFNFVFPFQRLHVLSMTTMDSILYISRPTASPRLGYYCCHGNYLG